MAPKIGGISITLVLLALLPGCQSALLTMKNEADETEIRIAIKEGELTQLQKQERALAEEKRKLVADLQSREGEVDSLYERLDVLRRENSRLEAETAESAKEKDNFDRKLKTYQQEALSIKDDKELSEIQKKERIKELREKIRYYLEMNL